MGQSFEDLLRDFCEVRDADYRTEPEHQEAMIRCMMGTMQTMLEKLRDRLDVR